VSVRHIHLRISLAAAALVVVALLGACKRDGNKPPSLGTVFAGPIKLDLREEISPKSKPIATVKHGDKLEVLQIRRRFVRVLTPDGKQGWTESRNLITDKQMGELQEMFKAAAKLPSQGEATVYGMLNIHTEPARLSTSFYQINEGVRVDVLQHKLATRNQPPSSTGLDLKKPGPVRPVKKKKKEPDYPPPPRPAAPGLPPDFVELSTTRAPAPPPEPPVDPNDKTKKKRKPKPKPTGPPMEDWSLVRTKDGKAGWVLTRMLVMAIPDEVAQYAEGARITSYFPLAEVNDEGQIKHHWLWTTRRNDAVPYHFDSFRVFTYVLKRHRYETAYIERNIEGYYPVEVTPGSLPKFSLVLRGADGQLYKKTWVLEGYMTRKVGEELYTLAEDEDHPAKPEPTLADRLRALMDDDKAN
jgi:hypothetical protein